MAAGSFDEWLALGYRHYAQADAAAGHVDELLARVEVVLAASERKAGVQDLKVWLGSPDWLDKDLEVFAYGRTLDQRILAGDHILCWLQGVTA